MPSNDFLTACQEGDLETVKSFCQNLPEGFFSRNPYFMYWACSYGHLEVVKVLCEHGATQDIIDLQEPYFQAIIYGYLSVVKFLFATNTDMPLYNDRGICLASNYGHFEIVKFLYTVGANVQAHDNLPMVYATYSYHFDIAKFLYQRGASIKFASQEGKRYLQFCDKMEAKRRIWAVNKIGSWWIPICYDLNRDCGKRMMEKGWNRIEDMV